jgi:hypothetical protein
VGRADTGGDWVPYTYVSLIVSIEDLGRKRNRSRERRGKMGRKKRRRRSCAENTAAGAISHMGIHVTE